MAIRWMGSKGQSTDSNLPHYHPAGLPLIPGYIELVEEGDSLAGDNNEHLYKIKIYSWKGPFAATGQDGAGWLLAENWWTYQAAGFVTPPFAGYYSGHSTYSRTAAEIMTLITGDEYFPGGMAEYTATQDEYLIADDGPSTTVKLQWATYRDASDQCSVSRIYGGLHPPQDDIPGRRVGLIVGPQAVNKANEFIHANPPHVALATQTAIITDANAGASWSVTITFDKAMDQSVTPQLILLNNAAAPSLVLTGGMWTDAFHYVAEYNVIDNNVTINNIVISAQGAQDLNGVNNLAGVSDAFSIDTQNPTATANLVGAEALINEADVAAGLNFNVLVQFSEEMNTSINPQFTFSEAGSSFVLDGSSAWTSSTEYRAVFNVVDNNAEATNIDLEISAATDAVGNNQLISMINDALNIDTNAPAGDLSISQNTISDSNTGDVLNVVLNYDSPMNTAIAPAIAVSGISLSNNFTLGGGSWNTEGTTFTANYVMLDGNVEAEGVNFTASDAQDLAGNTQTVSISSDALSIDTKNPVVNAVSAGSSLLADTDTGSPFVLAITFDEAMNAAAPTISFGQNIPSLTLNTAASSWNGNTYNAVYNLADNNIEVSGIIVTVAGASDAAGNSQSAVHFAYDVFSIDTQNPEVASLNTSTSVINSGDVGANTFAVTVNFTEAMDQTSTPDITFNPAAGLTPSADSGWDSDYTYTARYDVAAGESSVSNISVSVGTSAADAAGNPMLSATFENAFSIDIVNSVIELGGSSAWTIYPNPVLVGDDIRIQVQAAIATARIMIFDGQGKLVHDQNYTGNNGPLVVGTSAWAEGMYLVKLVSEHSQGSMPVSVVR
jgi:hypothetical protein